MFHEGLFRDTHPVVRLLGSSDMLSKDVCKLFVWFYCVFCLQARREHEHSAGATAVTVERHGLGGGGIVIVYVFAIFNSFCNFIKEENKC